MDEIIKKYEAKLDYLNRRIGNNLGDPTIDNKITNNLRTLMQEMVIDLKNIKIESDMKDKVIETYDCLVSEYKSYVEKNLK